MSDYIRTFNRYELKFLLHHRMAWNFIDSIHNFIRRDPFAGRDGFYKVVSRYYDSPDLMCYREKIDGEKYRRKVRVRTYGEIPDLAFAEIKQRYNITVQKRRTRAPLQEIEDQLDRMDAGDYQGGTDPVLDEIFVLRRQFELEPKLIVSYNRAAFFDLLKKDLRITIDRNFRTRKLDLSLVNHRTRGQWAIHPRKVVVEIKFNETIPRWLCTALNRFDLQIDRVSKYCYGVETLGLDNQSPRNRSRLSTRVVVEPDSRSLARGDR